MRLVTKLSLNEGVLPAQKDKDGKEIAPVKYPRHLTFKFEHDKDVKPKSHAK